MLSLQSAQHLRLGRDPEQPEVHGVQLSEWHPLRLLQFHAAPPDQEKFRQESQRGGCPLPPATYIFFTLCECHVPVLICNLGCLECRRSYRMSISYMC